MRFLMNVRVLFVVVTVLAVSILGVRVGDVWDAVETGRFFGHTAQAETKQEEKASPEKQAADNSAKDTASAAAKQEPPASVTPQSGEGDAQGRLVPPNSDTAEGEVEILNQLSKRREELDFRSRDLDKREALIKVAERRVDQKIGEMEALRKTLQSMVSQVSEAQAAQVENLVKIYETMKPEEAARILETLDMPVLLGVLQRMKPKSTAPIMAKMSPEKAKDVTVALTKQDQLPEVK